MTSLLANLTCTAHPPDAMPIPQWVQRNALALFLKLCQDWLTLQSAAASTPDVRSILGLVPARTPTAPKKRIDTPTTETAVSESETSEKWIDTNPQKPQQRRAVVVKVPQVRGYERVVTPREVTFTCNYCQQTVTQVRMPGPLSAYCSDPPLAAALRYRCRLDAAAIRKPAFRAETGKNKGKRGRPRNP